MGVSKCRHGRHPAAQSRSDGRRCQEVAQGRGGQQGLLRRNQIPRCLHEGSLPRKQISPQSRCHRNLQHLGRPQALRYSDLQRPVFRLHLHGNSVADPSFQLHGRPRRFSGDFHEPNSRQTSRRKDRHQRILLRRKRRRRQRKVGGGGGQQRRRRRSRKRRKSRRRRSKIAKVSRCLWLWYYGPTLVASPRAFVRSFVRSIVRSLLFPFVRAFGGLIRPSVSDGATSVSPFFTESYQCFFFFNHRKCWINVLSINQSLALLCSESRSSDRSSNDDVYRST